MDYDSFRVALRESSKLEGEIKKLLHATVGASDPFAEYSGVVETAIIDGNKKIALGRKGRKEGSRPEYELHPLFVPDDEVDTAMQIYEKESVRKLVSIARSIESTVRHAMCVGLWLWARGTDLFTCI